jgi:hypothetical protein
MEKRRAERMAWRSGMPGTMPPMHQGYQRPGGCMQKGGKHGMAQKGHSGGCMHKGGKHGMGQKGHSGGCMHKDGKDDAGKGKHKPRYSFEDIDLDGDGMISKEEFEKHRASR